MVFAEPENLDIMFSKVTCSFPLSDSQVSPAIRASKGKNKKPIIPTPVWHFLIKVNLLYLPAFLPPPLMNLVNHYLQIMLLQKLHSIHYTLFQLIWQIIRGGLSIPAEYPGIPPQTRVVRTLCMTNARHTNCYRHPTVCAGVHPVDVGED